MLSSFLRCLTMNEIIGALPSKTFSRAQKRSRGQMEEAVSRLPETVHVVLEQAAHTKKRRRLLVGTDPKSHMVQGDMALSECEDPFFRTVSEKCRQERISKFIDATGTSATTSSTCAVCAGIFFAENIREVAVSQLRDTGRLSPANPHPAHILTGGMLLHQSHNSLHTDEHGVLLANICNSCSSDIRREKTPSFVSR